MYGNRKAPPVRTGSAGIKQPTERLGNFTKPNRVDGMTPARPSGWTEGKSDSRNPGHRFFK